MAHQTTPLRTSDNLTLHTESWLPEGEPRAVIVVVHGYGEHLGRYRHVADYFVKQGYAVYTLDHRGHGQSEGLRAYVHSFDQFVEDLHVFVGQVKSAQPGHKLFILGHSMGALISLLYCIRYPDGIAGLIISGAPVNADANVPGYLVTLGSILNQIIPKYPFLKGDDYSVLSRDPEVGRAFEADPLTWTQPMRIRLGVEINRAAGQARAGVSTLTMPLLVMHGAADAYVNPSGSQLAYERAGSSDKTLKVYPNLRHEIMNEPEKYEVLADIAAWLEAHLG